MSDVEEKKQKAAVVRKAVLLAVGMFFFGVFLFLAIVIAVAKIATRS